MVKTIKKIVLSSLSILGISLLIWIMFLLNPGLSYANKTQFNYVTVYHNQDLSDHAEIIINEAITIIKRSDLFEEGTSIQFCLNDDELYPSLHPFAGQPLAYAMLNKTIIKNCKISFEDNVVETQWEVNENELRTFNLTWLLAHEFTHNLQYQANAGYVMETTLGKLNWKLEGHAEYIAREFKEDGRLQEKIDRYLTEENKKHIGLPVFEYKDGTKQILSYYKYAVVIQYLMEINQLDFAQICELESSLDEIYSEMIAWKENASGR